MVNSKLKVTIELPGRVMYSYKEALDNNLLKSDSVVISYTDKRSKRFIRERINFRIRKHKNAYQVITMSEDAYKDMISANIPEFSNRKEWNSLSKTQRLEKHLDMITKSLGGIAFAYSILED